MGPCSAMGQAAAHVLDLAAAGAVPSFGGNGIDFGSLTSAHDIDVGLLRSRIAANLGPAGTSGGR